MKNLIKILFVSTLFLTVYSCGKNGEERTYYESGNIHKIINYKNGKMDGEWVGYYKDGQLSRRTNYKNRQISSKEKYKDGKKIE